MTPERVSGGVRLGELMVSDEGRGRVSLRDCGGVLTSALAATGVAGTAPASEQGEYLVKPFRLLSAVLISGYWLDFTKPSLFEGKEALFDAKTVLCDHKLKVSEWVGVTTNPRRTTSQGVAGIDADLQIHREQDRVIFDGSIVRGLSTTPPAISSCSVTVEWRGRRSHEALDGWEFWCHLGEELGGERVRWIVEEIIRIHEVSLVYCGADPFARSLSAAATHHLAPGGHMSKIAALVRDLFGVDPETEAGAQAVRDAHRLQAEARRLSGKESIDQVLGVLQAHQASHGRVAELSTDLQKARGEIERMEKLNLLDEAINGKPDGKGGRIVKMAPAQRAWGEAQPLEALKSYLEAAPPLAQGTTFQPKADPVVGGPAVALTPFDKQQLSEVNKMRRASGAKEISEDEFLEEKRRRARAASEEK